MPKLLNNALSLSRRTLLRHASLAWSTSMLGPFVLATDDRPANPHGYVVGEPAVEWVGAEILAGGGNAFDALVATALAAAVAQPQQTGMGGYGAQGILAYGGGKHIVALDANTVAPAALPPDIFKPGHDGKVRGTVNERGWLAAGVPGVLAGLKLILDRCGTRAWGDMLQPAIRLARDGFRLTPNLANAMRALAPQLAKDPGSRRLYLPHGRVLPAGAVFQNSELADLLETLAKANSIEPFYRGTVARRIADAFAAHGGLVTLQDLAAYQARLVEPLIFCWDADVIHTCPLPSGGLSMLQVLATMKAMDWAKLPAGIERTHAQLEALRIAWRDRLALLGDPEFVNAPQTRLLSADYADQCAAQIRAAVKSRTILEHRAALAQHDGTLSFSAADKHGNFAALTLTHGNSFGACVTVDGLGLTLGHGMSRFDPNPGHPNAPGPRKRPLHNMAPTLVTRGGRPIVAVGGRGGRRIPNSILEFLIQFVILRQSAKAAIAAPRLHTQGDRTLELEKNWPQSQITALATLGYQVKSGPAATLSAVAVEHDGLRALMR